MKGCVFMASTYYNNFKKKLCEDICIYGKSTSITAKEFNLPLKTLEKWITSYHKDSHCFDSLDNDFKIIKPTNSNVSYDDLSKVELKNILMKKDIEISRLKKGYMVKGDGTENKVFITLFKKNTK